MGQRSVIRIAVWVCVCASSVPAGEILLSLDPGLKFSQEASPDRKQNALIATLPLNYERETGCVMEIDFTMVGIWYYAPLRMGIRSAYTKAEIGLWFEKAGGDSSECRLYVRQNGQEKVAAKWETVDCKKYRLVLRWNKDGKVDFIARKGVEVVFQASCEGPLPLTPDEFFMRVINNNDNGYIGYDCEDESIFMRSQPGGGDYVASAFIDFISMKTPAKGASK